MFTVFIEVCVAFGCVAYFFVKFLCPALCRKPYFLCAEFFSPVFQNLYHYAAKAKFPKFFKHGDSAYNKRLFVIAAQQPARSRRQAVRKQHQVERALVFFIEFILKTLFFYKNFCPYIPFFVVYFTISIFKSNLSAFRKTIPLI